MSVKEKVQERLREHGSLSSADIGAFAPVRETTEEKKHDPMEETTIADIPKEAKNDLVLGTQQEKIAPDVIANALANNPAGFDLDPGKIELTPEDKAAFLETIVMNTRYTRPFSLFDGRLEGVFRSRLNKESRAILLEMRRQLISGELESDIEYTTRMRHALLYFQLEELNGLTYEIPAGNLTAKSVMHDGVEKITPPDWVKDCEARFEGDEARTVAMYSELAIFESKYWTLVANANNQDFWKTEDSSSE